jgi:formylmethanofuran dehydrogenase subunit D
MSNLIVKFDNNGIGTVENKYFLESLTNVGLTIEQVNAMQQNSDAFIARIAGEAIDHVKVNNLCNGEGDGVKVMDVYMGDLYTGNVVISSTGSTVVGITQHSGDAMKLIQSSMEDLWTSCNVDPVGTQAE